MRLLLIVNVNASLVTPWAINVIERALSSELDVEVARTKRQDHATHLARGAAHEGFDVVASPGVDRRRPRVRLRWGPNLEHERGGLFLAICQKTSPFTYLGSREMHLCPEARLEKGLDLLALDTLRTPTVLRIVAQTFGSRKHVRNRH